MQRLGLVQDGLPREVWGHRWPTAGSARGEEDEDDSLDSFKEEDEDGKEPGELDAGRPTARKRGLQGRTRLDHMGFSYAAALHLREGRPMGR